MSRPIVIVLHGPSGAGKDSVIDRLRERTGIHRATSSTSREPRDGEVDGNHYHFLSEKEFEAKIRRREFAEHARVYGQYKGLERAEIEEPLREGRDVIIRTDVQGARTWRKKIDGAVSILLVPSERPRPSVRVRRGNPLTDDQVDEIRQLLKSRLEQRDSETAESLKVRLDEVDAELKDLPNNDYVVFNAEGALDETVRAVEEIIRRESKDPARPAPQLV